MLDEDTLPDPLPDIAMDNLDEYNQDDRTDAKHTKTVKDHWKISQVTIDSMHQSAPILTPIRTTL
jgi:hypothetical protein